MDLSTFCSKATPLSCASATWPSRSRGERINDTSREIERKYREMLLQRSGEERLKMGCSMHATAKALARASILHEQPDASPATIRRALFLRFYGHEFDAQAREKILLALKTVKLRG